VSKIEKALNKARATGGLRVVASQPPRTEEEHPSGNLPAAVGAMALIEQGGSVGQVIARMRENLPLDQHVLAQRQIIYPEMGENGTVRAFREIRTKIIKKTQGQNCTIMVTSVAAGGGSSFVTLNLGAAFSFDAGKTALLLDCNFKNPSLHRLFGAGTFRGLKDYLENSDMDVAEIIHPVGIERLRIIPSGGRREIPSEYFTSLKMKQLLESIKQRYRERYIILDAPPMTESADTQILAELCDYIVLVAPYGRVTESRVDVCAKAIGEKKLIGIIFNNEPAPPAFKWRSILNPFVALWEILFRPVKNSPEHAK
jgi:protein-tyrosine kinase